jgi:hypothetical protein
VVLIDLVEDEVKDELSDSNLTVPFRSPGHGVEPSSDVSSDRNLSEDSRGDVDMSAVSRIYSFQCIFRVDTVLRFFLLYFENFSQLLLCWGTGEGVFLK